MRQKRTVIVPQPCEIAKFQTKHPVGLRIGMVKCNYYIVNHIGISQNNLDTNLQRIVLINFWQIDFLFVYDRLQKQQYNHEYG